MSDWIKEVHALADGELKGEAKERAMKLVETDERAAAEYQWASYLKKTVSTNCVNTGHEETWEKCKSRLDELDAVGANSRVESFVGKFGWAMASVLFLVILSAGLLNWGIGKDEISSTQFASLFNGDTLFEQVEVDGAQSADKILQERIGTKLPHVEPIVQIVAVSHGTIDGDKVVRVDLFDSVGPLSLFIYENAKSVESLEPIAQREEYAGGQFNRSTVVSWVENDNVLMIVADRSLDEMVSIADRMRAERQ